MMSGNISSPILAFPVELGQHILSFCHPWDVAVFSQTCRAAYSLVYHTTDQYLWRQLFLNEFDVPKLPTSPTSPMNEQYDWKKELTKRMKVELTLLRGPTSEKEQNASFETLIAVINESSSITPNRPFSSNIKWLKHLILGSRLLSNLYSQDKSADNAELCAHLRSCLAMTIDNHRDQQALDLLLDRRDKSRAFVYDLRNYHSNNKWGPFKVGGAINWVHVEHLIDVVALNIRELPGSWVNTRPPSCIDAPRFFNVAKTSDEFPFNDWAGVQGTWHRYVCFMDYRDLYAFNFTDLADGPRNPKFFKDPFREATRLMEVKLNLVPVQKMRYHRLPENSVDKQNRFPPLCFTGTSKAVHGNDALVEGYVIMGEDGVPRWQLTSIYDGHAQWSSTGVQIGGPKSAMGVVGVWTTTHHDQDDPVGPAWLWKAEDDLPTRIMETPA